MNNFNRLGFSVIKIGVKQPEEVIRPYYYDGFRTWSHPPVPTPLPDNMMYYLWPWDPYTNHIHDSVSNIYLYEMYGPRRRPY